VTKVRWGKLFRAFKLKVTAEGPAAGALIVNTTGSPWAQAAVMPPKQTKNANTKRAQCALKFMVNYLRKKGW
jgi:hypothetical protein